MTDTLSFSLPWPPSVNHCWRHVTRGGRSWAYLTEEAEKYKEAAFSAAWRSLNCKCPSDWHGTFDLVVEFRLFQPDKRKRDADNLFKLSLDAIAQGIGVDDSRFLPRVMSREIDRENPRVEVRVYREER